MTDFAQRVAQFNELTAAFRYEDAFEQFYHDDVVKHENENAPTLGLANHRRAMAVFLSKISNAAARPLQTLLSDDISATEWHYRFDHEDWGKRDFRQVSVQRWRDGRIVHERHLYKSENW